MTASAASYAWFMDKPAGLSEAYCLTLARGLSAAEFLRRAGARPQQRRTGAAALFGPSMSLWEAEPRQGLLIGVTTVAGRTGTAAESWALGLEVNGYLGVTESVIVPLSAGTTVVSHFRGGNATDHFYWLEDRDIRLHFEPLFPGYRQGSTPDAVLPAMRGAGFSLGEDEENEHPTEAALALAERLTGVRVTPELLATASYACGIVPVPPL